LGIPIMGNTQRHATPSAPISAARAIWLYSIDGTRTMVGRSAACM
jgi:hypothetical protein